MPLVGVPFAGNVDAHADLGLASGAVAVANAAPVISAIFDKEQPARAAERKNRMPLAVIAVPTGLDPKFECSIGGKNVIHSRKKDLVAGSEACAICGHARLVADARGRDGHLTGLAC